MTDSSLFNKHIPVPEIKTQHFDNSEEYVIVKKTKDGSIKVLKPEIIQEIKDRLELEP